MRGVGRAPLLPIRGVYRFYDIAAGRPTAPAGSHLPYCSKAATGLQRHSAPSGDRSGGADKRTSGQMFRSDSGRSPDRDFDGGEVYGPVVTTRAWDRANPDFEAAIRACGWGSLIRLTREAAGLSQEHLARRLHCLQPTVARWEDPRNVPRVRTLAAITAELSATLKISLLVNDELHDATFDGASYRDLRDRRRLASILQRRVDDLLVNELG